MENEHDTSSTLTLLKDQMTKLSISPATLPLHHQEKYEKTSGLKHKTRTKELKALGEAS